MNNQKLTEIHIKGEPGNQLHEITKVGLQIRYGLAMCGLQFDCSPTIVLQQKLFMVAHNGFAVPPMPEKLDNFAICRSLRNKIANKNQPVVLTGPDLIK